MKKILLPIFAFMLSLTAANAQTLAENQMYYPAHGTLTETTGDATKIEGYDDYYDFYRSYMDMDMDAVFARFSAEDLAPYVGYKIVGMSVAGEFGQEKVDFLLNLNCNQVCADEKEHISSKNVAIVKAFPAVPSSNAAKVYKWNDVMFDTPYTIPAKKENPEAGDPDDLQDVYAGYWIKDADGKIVMDNLLVSQYYSDVLEEGEHTEIGTYVQQTGASTKVPRLAGLAPRLLPVQLILEGTGAAAINGTTAATATEKARYSADGKRVYLPVRGLNIVKMSDGTSRKVLVNK